MNSTLLEQKSKTTKITKIFTKEEYILKFTSYSAKFPAFPGTRTSLKFSFAFLSGANNKGDFRKPFMSLLPAREKQLVYYILAIFFQDCRLETAGNNRRGNTWNSMLKQLECDKHDRYFCHTWSQFSNKKYVSHTGLDDIHLNIRWQIYSSVSFLRVFSPIRISLWYFKTILRHFLKHTEYYTHNIIKILWSWKINRAVAFPLSEGCRFRM